MKTTLALLLTTLFACGGLGEAPVLDADTPAILPDAGPYIEITATADNPPRCGAGRITATTECPPVGDWRCQEIDPDNTLTTISPCTIVEWKRTFVVACTDCPRVLP
jgi:hypothetical protein